MVAEKRERKCSTAKSALRGFTNSAAGQKKKTPRLRGLCRLFADILVLLAILAAVQRIPVAKMRFLRDVLGQQINHHLKPGKVAICSTPCKP